MTTAFNTATDFRKSLEARLKQRSRLSGIDLQRLRRQVAFDRLLARIFHTEHSPFALKGGYAMELRFTTARTTKDLDLATTLRAPSSDVALNPLIHDELVELASLDLHDFFSYAIASPRLELGNAPYGGARYPVTVTVDDRVFVQFHLDVGADRKSDIIETIIGEDWLDFCGIEPARISIISIEQQLAEKLHAYTRPREAGTNTRVKDLVDMLLLCRNPALDIAMCEQTLCAKFRTRGSHSIPQKLPPPPESWTVSFSSLASECGLQPDLVAAFDEVQHVFLNICQIVNKGV